MTAIEPSHQPEPPHYPPYRQPPGYWYPPAPPTSALAVVSLVFGILWLFWVGSLVAIITGHLALRECREQGLGGNGLAVAGLVLGYIGAATFAVPFFFGIVGTIAGV